MYCEGCMYPEIKGELIFNELYANKTKSKGKIIIGVSGCDKYITIPQDKKEIYERLLGQMNGTNSIQDISNRLNINYEVVEVIVKKLFSVGFLVGLSKEKSHNDYTDMMTKNIVKKDLEIKKIYNIAKIFILFTVFVTLVCYFGKYDLYVGGFFKIYVWINIFMTPVLVMHEFGHSIAAYIFGIKKCRITVGLYGMVMPNIYISYLEIYKLEKKKLLVLLLAGVIMNAVMALVFFALYIGSRNNLFLIITISNIRAIIYNLIPFGLTDGYFVFSIISKKPNIRKKLYESIAYPYKFFGEEVDYQVLILCSMIVMSFMIAMEVKSIIGLFNIDVGFVFCIIISLVIIYTMIRYRTGRIEKNDN